MKTLYSIEVKQKGTNQTMIVFASSGNLAVYEFKKIAKDRLVELYEEHFKEMKRLGVKPIAKNRFVIKEYVLKGEKNDRIS